MWHNYYGGPLFHVKKIKLLSKLAENIFYSMEIKINIIKRMNFKY